MQESHRKPPDSYDAVLSVKTHSPVAVQEVRTENRNAKAEEDDTCDPSK